MKKYRIVSNWTFEQNKIGHQNLNPWEIEYRRFAWREHYHDLVYKRHTVSFGDSIDFISSQENIDDQVIRKIYVQYLFDSLNELSDEEQYIIIAYYFDGKSDKRIASALGKNQRYINRKRNKILGKLRILIKSRKKDV